MGAYLAVFIFFAVLGLLVFAYALNFRHRALRMGSDHLRAALSRTTTGDEEAGREELLEAAQELDRRLGRTFIAMAALLIADLASCVSLALTSTLPGLSLALSGSCVFLAAIVTSIALLRDIPRAAIAGLTGEDT
ncbi:MAG: hypothetical protein HPY75_06910 [Actinobacteria bacterium]|nr:hypothetical protein [Actinomycetota bacterium]